MGLFDKLKGRKMQQLSKDPLDKKNIESLNKKYEEEMKNFAEQTQKNNGTVASYSVPQPSNNRMDAIARDEAILFDKERKQREFDQKHKKIIAFKKELQSDLGLSGQVKSEAMKRYEKMLDAKSFVQTNINKLFLPYLVEKKALKIITPEEQKELDVLLGKTGTDTSKATTIESFANDYDNALILLGTIGVLDIDENGTILGYDNGKALKGIKSLTDFEINLHIESLAKSSGISLTEVEKSNNAKETSQDDDLSL